MPVRVISQKDGRTKTRLYQIYTSMKDRCYRAKSRDYARYGATELQLGTMNVMVLRVLGCAQSG